MNYFVLVNGFLYMCAAGYSAWAGHGMGWSVVWLSYGISAMVLAFLEG